MLFEKHVAQTQNVSHVTYDLLFGMRQVCNEVIQTHLFTKKPFIPLGVSIVGIHSLQELLVIRSRSC